MDSLLICSYVILLLFGMSSALGTPRYEILEKFEMYEIRAYPMTTWVSTTDVNPENIKSMFLRLFYYMQGANSEGRTLEMTAPMLRHFHEDGNVTLLLYVSTALLNIPEPTDTAVNITQLPERHFAVWQFGGFATDEIWIEELEKFKEASRDNTNVTMDEFFEASYSGFHDTIDRRNEIWFVHNSGQPATSPATTEGEGEAPPPPNQA